MPSKLHICKKSFIFKFAFLSTIWQDCQGEMIDRPFDRFTDLNSVHVYFTESRMGSFSLLPSLHTSLLGVNRSPAILAKKTLYCQMSDVLLSVLASWAVLGWSPQAQGVSSAQSWPWQAGLPRLPTLSHEKLSKWINSDKMKLREPFQFSL